MFSVIKNISMLFIFLTACEESLSSSTTFPTDEVNSDSEDRDLATRIIIDNDATYNRTIPDFSLEQDHSTMILDEQTDMAQSSIVDIGSPDEMCDQTYVVEIQANLESTTVLDLEACQSPHIKLVIPTGSHWQLELNFSSQTNHTYSLPIRGSFFDSFDWRNYLGEPSPQNGISIIEAVSSGRNRVSFDLNAGRSGEHHLLLYQQDDQAWVPQVNARLQMSLSCLAGCELNSTRYPIVLVHGYAGVDQYFGILDYFYRVPTLLREKGFAVFVPSLSPIELTSVRAQELSVFLDRVQAESGAEKFNLIAHSQGGLDSRFLISTLGEQDRIASLTTIATPHQGIPIELLDFFSRQSFAQDTIEQFNQENPPSPQVSYFSWSARTCTLLEPLCLRSLHGEVVTPFLLATYTLLRAYGFNDGLVPTESMLYGIHLGELNADHFDQIGQIADQNRGAFAHLEFYLNEALRLQAIDF